MANTTDDNSKRQCDLAANHIRHGQHRLTMPFFMVENGSN